MMLSNDSKSIQGMNITLQCVAAGYPTPTITWLKSGVPLSLSMNTIVYTSPATEPYNIVNEGLFGVISRMKLKEVQQSDNGDYSCLATTTSIKFEAIAVSEEIQLTVIGQ